MPRTSQDKAHLPAQHHRRVALTCHGLSVQSVTVGLLKNDIVVLGTDGLWDNLFAQEVAQVARTLQLRGHPPQTTAAGLAEIARKT